MRAPHVLAVFCAVAAAPALAVQSCELNGQHVNPDNGNSTAGKTGLMRCRDGEGGPVVREQELQGGVFKGAVRYYSDGQLSKDYRVNERGNRDGVAREYARGEGGAKPVLVREETYRDGRTVGIARSWYPNGQLRRVSFHGDDDRELASAEFTTDGKLYELRCGPRAVLGPDADDARWCGHAGGASNVVLYNGKGVAKARVSYERGERRKSELLGSDGALREQEETTASGGVLRVFHPNGNRRLEQQWVTTMGERAGRVQTLEQEFDERGKLVHERRWRVGERGGEPTLEQSWYLNGQPQSRLEFSGGAGGASRRLETGFHDNGTKSFEGAWFATSPRSGVVAIGVHRTWDEAGHLRTERHYDERGRITRERELDGTGNVVRDDEVFEDGSRKAYAK
jgi:antitoxin component YwqK of YwqJK toxin-antitoxin module